MADTEAEALGDTEVSEDQTCDDVTEDESTEPEAVGVKCVLLDIEGTICPISFVKDTLFPYALKALPDVLATKWNDEDFRTYRDAFPEDKRSSPETLQAYVEALTKEDRKDACHKNLQGYLWENGYKTGAYATPLFPDVAPRLKQWKDTGLTLAIYSSGSVFAQKLLFGHVQVQPSRIVEGEATNPGKERFDVDGEEAAAGQKRSINDAAGLGGGSRSMDEPPTTKAATGKDGSQVNSAEGVASAPSQGDGQEKPATEDLQYLITDWFDTMNAGPKKEASSYEKVAEALKLPPVDILFLTDSVEEYDASTAAGLKASLIMRPGNPRLKREDFDWFKIMWSLENVNP